MRSILTILTFSLLSGICSGQDFHTEFVRYFQQGDSSKQLETLKKWEKADPKNPELLTSYFNYYFLQSRQEFVSLTTTQPEGESLSLQDSTGKQPASWEVRSRTTNEETAAYAHQQIEELKK